MMLSTSTPKSDKRTIKTCFLRTVGNRVSDEIAVQTVDFVEIHIRVGYQVVFDPEHTERWFTHDNYVQVMCDHLRSLVRGRCRQLALADLWPTIPAVIRDTILGERTEAGRTGRLFDDNGMRVTEVEVLSSAILDKEIAGLLEKVQREGVSLHISDRQADEKLRSEKLRHEIERQRMDLAREQHERRAEVDAVVSRLQHQRALQSTRDKEAQSSEAAQLAATRITAELTARLGRDQQELEAKIARWAREVAAEVEANEMRHSEKQTHEGAMSKVRQEERRSTADAVVAERTAIQPALVEALTGLGDKALLEAVAENMNLVSLFRGDDIATIFQQVLGGTKLRRTLAGMLPEPGPQPEPEPEGVPDA